MELAANLSFMFKEREFLDRFRAAAACGKIYIFVRRVSFPLVRGHYVWSDGVGFRGVEFGSEVVLLYGKEVLVAAKDAAGVEVVNISAALG